VTGAIDTGKLDDFVRCGLGRAIFHGSIEESSLNGTITGSVFAGLSSYTGTAHGALSGTTLDIECVFTPTPENDPPYSGSLHLHR
jgi:hypothetical protein